MGCLPQLQRVELHYRVAVCGQYAGSIGDISVRLFISGFVWKIVYVMEPEGRKYTNHAYILVWQPRCTCMGTSVCGMITCVPDDDC
jgi:hypothetical protein